MNTELLEIEPRELKFVFELKKQSSRLVQLENKSGQYVAFKEMLKRRINVTGVQVGFPLLYVCMVALISVAVGYYIHP